MKANWNSPVGGFGGMASVLQGMQPLYGNAELPRGGGAVGPGVMVAPGSPPPDGNAELPRGTSATPGGNAELPRGVAGTQPGVMAATGGSAQLDLGTQPVATSANPFNSTPVAPVAQAPVATAANPFNGVNATPAPQATPTVAPVQPGSVDPRHPQIPQWAQAVQQQHPALQGRQQQPHVPMGQRAQQPGYNPMLGGQQMMQTIRPGSGMASWKPGQSWGGRR
jgi:hypothetical protein